MSVFNLTSLKDDPLALELQNRQLAEHNQALAAALRDANERSEQAMELLSRDIKDLEEERMELEESLQQRSSRVQELESQLSVLRRRHAPRPAPPPPPAPTNLDRMIAKALKLIVLGRAEESLEIFARLGGLSPSLATFYQKMFHSWVVVGTRMEGGRFARRIVFGMKGKLRERFLRAYCLALEELCKRPGMSPVRRRQWLLELAELHLENPRRAMAYLMKARKAS